MIAPTTNIGLKTIMSTIVRQALIWLPIVVGVVHQFLMFAFDIKGIAVFVDPPGYIMPLVSLGYEWWLVLLFFSAIISVLVYSGQLRSLDRLAPPLYIYALFLLILVEPI